MKKLNLNINLNIKALHGAAQRYNRSAAQRSRAFDRRFSRLTQRLPIIDLPEVLGTQKRPQIDLPEYWVLRNGLKPTCAKYLVPETA